MNCKYCGKTLANNDAAEEHAGTCPVMNADPEPCQHCDGNGYHIERQWVPYGDTSAMQTLEIDCDYCGGTGIEVTQ